ncbi:hypothetical protein ACHAXT_001630 [Thalassiosira profunda]
MFALLKCMREEKIDCEAKGDFSSENYLMSKQVVEELEREIGDATETIDYSDKNHTALPDHISKAAYRGDTQKVLAWLGPLPVDKERINAKDTMSGLSLVCLATWRGNSELLSILLQLGADVNSPDAAGGTPLGTIGKNLGCYAQARLLLEWGADIDTDQFFHSHDDFIGSLLGQGNTKLATLMKSEFGGRRCEIINLHNRLDLVGKTCVVEKYLPDRDRYKVIFERSQEAGLVRPENLKRRDRTPDDCGYYIEYKNGRNERRDFASKEECQAFRASLAKRDGEAVARSEQAAASLLADLNLEDSPAGSEKKGKARKKKGKKKGRKK